MLKRCVAVTHTGAVLTYDALPISDRPTDWGGNSWQYSQSGFLAALGEYLPNVHSLTLECGCPQATHGGQSIGGLPPNALEIDCHAAVGGLCVNSPHS